MINTGFPALDNIPDLECYNLSYVKLASLRDSTPLSAHNIALDKKINSVWTLTFDISLDNPKYKYLINENLIKFDNEYYFIKSPNIAHSIDKKMVTVTCLHLSSSLNNRINQIVNLVGQSATSLMTSVLTGSGFSVGIVDVGTNMRSLQTNGQSVFSNLITIATLYFANLYFHSDTKKVDLLSYTSTYIPDRQIWIRKGKSLRELNYTPDTTNIVTQFDVFGGDSSNGSGAISINAVNLINPGQSSITNYNWYLSQGYTQAYIDAHPELFFHEQRLDWSNYIDPQLLYDDAVKKLAQVSQPVINVTVKGTDLSCFPEEMILSPILGETVHIFDPDLNTNISATVTEIKKNYDDPLNLDITLTNVIVYTSIVQQMVDSSKLSQKNINGSGQQRGSTIQGMINLLQAQLNSTISGVSTDANGNLIIESSDKLKALKLSGGSLGCGIRTLAEKNASIDYHYNTGATGDGIIADIIYTGLLAGGYLILATIY